MEKITFTKLGTYGRIGNQLFQVAAILGLSKKFGAKACIPTNWKYRKYFNIPDEYFEDVTPSITSFEPYFHYCPDYLEGVPGSVINLEGTYQCEKYFENIKEDIKKWFTPKNLRYHNKCGIHIRRGDYINNPCYVNYSIGYYLAAIEKLAVDEIIAVSDDKEYLKYYGLPNTKSKSEIDDLKTLIGSRQLILSNSSYSWWGAYLSKAERILRPPKIFAGKLERENTEKDFWIEKWECFQDKINLKDFTFIIPVKYDHTDRKENLDIILDYLLKNFDTNIIVGEQGTNRFKYVEDKVRYVKFDYLTEFHRTHMLNRMTMLSKTPYVVNLDSDILVTPGQYLNTAKELRNGADIVYPYNGQFLRVGEGVLSRVPDHIETIKKHLDLYFFKDNKFHGTEDTSVGGVVAYNKESFIKAGMENENFISYAPEDFERFERFNKLGLKVIRIDKPLWHLNHFTGIDSSAQNPHFKQGHIEYDKIRFMKKDELQKCINTWDSGRYRKLVLVTYADDNYKEKQDELTYRALKSGMFEEVFSYTRKDIEGTDFYKENKHILDLERGAGYWLWKPYLILETMNKINAFDVILYMDCGDIFWGDLRKFAMKKTVEEDIILTKGGYKNKLYTKQLCFDLMKCNDEIYKESIQIEAGIILCKKSEFSIKIMKQWLNYCKKEDILTDVKIKNEAEYFIDHRHDQSILTNIAIKNNLYISNEIRDYIACNTDFPKGKTDQLWLYDDDYKIEKINARDVTFVIPVKIDSEERKKNIIKVVDFLQLNFDSQILIGENGSKEVESLFKGVEFHRFDQYPFFYRTKIINLLVKKVKTPFAYVWDTDILCNPKQIIESINKLRDGFDISYPYSGRFINVQEMDDSSVIETILHEDSVGGAFGFNKHSYVKVGMENENFEKWGYEDLERMERFSKLGLKIHRSEGSLFHLDHKREHGKNSHYLINMNEYRKVKRMNKTELKNYVEGWVR